MVNTTVGNFNDPYEAIDKLEERLANKSEVKKERPKSKLLFILTMPNVGSWNGKWTGADRVYAIVRPVKGNEICKEGNYYYNFGDGWGANIEVRKVTVVEANRYAKKSSGFCGYSWMVDSILQFNEIMTPEQQNKVLKRVGN